MDVSDLNLVAQFPLYVASVSLAMVAGFLSLIPGGAVVRELVLAELMAPRFGDVVAVVSALLLRLTWLVAELVISAILYFVRPGRADILQRGGSRFSWQMAVWSICRDVRRRHRNTVPVVWAGVHGRT